MCDATEHDLQDTDLVAQNSTMSSNDQPFSVRVVNFWRSQSKVEKAHIETRDLHYAAPSSFIDMASGMNENASGSSMIVTLQIADSKSQFRL